MIMNDYYLDISANGHIHIIYAGCRFPSGYDKAKAEDLVKRLNAAHRPNIQARGEDEIIVCWNLHEKHEACCYVCELSSMENSVSDPYDISDMD
jgi:hypothetical protein